VRGQDFFFSHVLPVPAPSSAQRIAERRQRIDFGHDPVVPGGYGLAEVEFEIVLGS